MANVSSTLLAMWQFFSSSDVEYFTLKNISAPSVAPPALLAMCSVIVVVWMSPLAYLSGYQLIYMFVFCVLFYKGFFFIGPKSAHCLALNTWISVSC